MDALALCVDHVVVPTEDPHDLYRVFADALGVPSAWPVRSHHVFEAGAVTFGNSGMEILLDRGSGMRFFEPQLPVVVRGIAMKPSVPLEQVAAALDERQIAHEGIAPFGQRKDGSPVGRILNVKDMVGDACTVYFVEAPGSDLLCGAAAAEALAAAEGGPLGIVALDEIQVGVGDVTEASMRWQSLLDPIEPVEAGCWAIGDGPRIRLKESPIVGVAGIVVRVRSVESARAALRERRLLGAVKHHGCGLRHPDTHGLDVWLVER